MQASPRAIAFENTNITIIDHNGKPWLTAPDIANALGYKQANQVTRLYQRNQSEFTDEMTEKVNLTLSGNLQSETRIFSPRGCHLIAMFARTDRAADFRRWVLDVLENYQHQPPQQQITSIPTYQLPQLPPHQVVVNRQDLANLLHMTGMTHDRWREMEKARDALDHAQNTMRAAIGQLHDCVADTSLHALPLKRALS